MSRSTKVSVVIPAYNEEKYLANCLNALRRQTVQPYEIIVVDNNSTDQTAAVARQCVGVKVLSESRQGIAAARTRGFDVARGEIIARLDADAQPPRDWLAQLTRTFEQTDYAAVTGPVEDLPLGKYGRYLRELLAHHYNERLAGHTMLFGANMAMRRSIWQAIRHQICQLNTIHEDLDLAIHLHRAGYALGYDRRLVVKTAARRYARPTSHFYRYLMLWPRTYAQHEMPGVGQLTLMMYILLVSQFCLRPLFVLYTHISISTALQPNQLMTTKRVRRASSP